MRTARRFLNNCFSGYDRWLAAAGFTALLVVVIFDPLAEWAHLSIGPSSIVGQVIKSAAGYGSVALFGAVIVTALWRTAQEEALIGQQHIDLSHSLTAERVSLAFQPRELPYRHPGTLLAIRCTNTDGHFRTLNECRARLDSVEKLEGTTWTPLQDFRPVFLLWEDERESASLGSGHRLDLEVVGHDTTYGMAALIRHGDRYHTLPILEGHWRATITWTAASATSVFKHFEFNVGARARNMQWPLAWA